MTPSLGDSLPLLRHRLSHDHSGHGNERAEVVANTFQLASECSSSASSVSRVAAISGRLGHSEPVFADKQCHVGPLSEQNETPHVRLVFSHLERERECQNLECQQRRDLSTPPSCSCGYSQGPILPTLDSDSDLELVSTIQTCPNCGLPSDGNLQSSEDLIVNSLHSLSLSSHPRSNPTSPTGVDSSSLPLSSHLLGHDATRVPGLSCRQQAHAASAGGGYLDDTTVDDLAGYFDQLLYLPRPMSDMAELMYT